MRVGAQLGLALAIIAAGGSARADQEPASKVVKRVAKSTRKLKSYQVQAQISAGKAVGADHRLTQKQVDQTFTCQVYARVARINDGQAFRLRLRGRSGAVRDGSIWKALLATEKGRLIARLFLRPEEHLATAARCARKARWVPPSQGPQPTFFNIDDEEQKKAGTRARGKKKAPPREAEQPLSHVIRIEGPRGLALRRFTDVVNSGCFGGG